MITNTNYLLLYLMVPLSRKTKLHFATYHQQSLDVFLDDFGFLLTQYWYWYCLLHKIIEARAERATMLQEAFYAKPVWPSVDSLMEMFLRVNVTKELYY